MLRRLVLCALALGGCDLQPQDEPAGYRSRAPRDPSLPAEASGTDESGPATLASTEGDPAGPVGNGGGGTAAPPSPTPAATSKLAERLAITEIAVFQGVKVSVAKSGAKVTSRSMPIIAGRDALIRVYVKPDAGYTSRSVRAQFHLVNAGQGLPIATQTMIVSAASTESAPSSTFNFEVSAALLGPGVEYFVQLIDDGAPEVATNVANAAQYPNVAGTESLDATSGADSLKIVLVPLRYGADGSNRLPDTGGTMVDALRKRTLELYPVPAVDITVHAPLDHASAIAADGTGWDSALAKVTQLRMTENPAADVYYYGVFAPAATAPTYCPASCVLGLSNLASSVSDATSRASVGVLYNNVDVIGTMPHELGHAHGRRHAPCGNAAGADPSYPYPEATIGVWGYSIVTKKLFSPTATTEPHDFMSYCGPEWTSDYTFKALFDRGRALKTASIKSLSSLSAPLIRRPLRFMFEGPAGLRWDDNPAVWSAEPLGGEEHIVTFYAEDGTVVARDTAHRYPYDHLAGSYLILPDPPPLTARVEVAGLGSLARP